jgi:DNA processing protein
MIDQRQAWAYLSRVAEPPCAELVALLASVGPSRRRIGCGRAQSRESWHVVPKHVAKSIAPSLDLDRIDRLDGR